jgi:hypothetical protein
VWSAKTITVSFDNSASVYAADGSTYLAENLTQNGNTVPNPLSITGVYGQSITLPVNPYVVPTGYQFGGWTDGTTTYTPNPNNNNQISYSLPASDITLNAVWVPIVYSLTYSSLQYFSPAVTVPSTVITSGHIGQSVTLWQPAYSTFNGYPGTFVGWMDNANHLFTPGTQFTFGNSSTDQHTILNAWENPGYHPNGNTQLAR